ncbi:MAG: amidohydrolase [Lewinellaceae bacterium]|nr:amidohydrolase [Lewinellaceae bacterium]
MPLDNSEFKELSQRYYGDILAIRRHLHQFPELSFQENETSKFVCQQLAEWGIPYQAGIGGTGIVAMIRGGRSGGAVTALRADLDALPIQEANDKPYRSRNDGVMHACGHDVHTSSLLGAARILHRLRDQLRGDVKLIFQPGEEKNPGGASILIKEGVLENPRPATIFGQHVYPSLETGKVGFRAGQYMASADELYLTVTGKGGHGAMPQDCVDPITVSAQIITAVQQLVSRNSDPILPVVLTFGYIASNGGATNVIPDSVRLKGTFRTMDEKWRREAHVRIRKLVEGIAEAMGAKADLHIDVGYPCLQNDEVLTARTEEYARRYLGPENVVELPIRMTSEDFAYYSHEIPACFYRLGTGNIAKGITSPVHSNTFDIDEPALETGMGLMAWIAASELEKEG